MLLRVVYTLVTIWLSSIIGPFPRVIDLYQLQCSVPAAGTLGHIYPQTLHYAQGQRYFYQAFMQRQFHFFEHFINTLMAISVAQISVCSYLGKPNRQYMLFKTADKFCAAECHLLLFITVSIILILKSYCILLIIYTAYSVITDSHLMSIAA